MSLGHELPGYCIIEINGGSIERFSNLAMERNIMLWDITVIGPQRWEAKVALKSLRSLRQIGHLTESYIIVKEKKGIPAIARKLRRHFLLVAAAVAIVFALVVYAHSILGVNVVSDETLPSGVEQEVLSIAAEQGVKPKLFFGDMDWESVSEEILRRCPDLSWVGFQKEGVTIKIRVVPRDTVEDLTTVPGHIVADKDGVVEEILVLQGKPCIETGKAVKAGDIIISGYVTYEDESGNETSPANLVHAKGIVRGTSWYTGKGYAGLTVADTEPTGDTVESFSLNFMGREYLLWGTRRFDFAEYEAEEGQMTPPWQETPLFSWKTVREMKSRQKEISSDEAMTRAEEIARENAMKQVPDDAEVVHESFRYLGEENGAVGVEITIETREDLGTFQEVTSE